MSAEIHRHPANPVRDPARDARDLRGILIVCATFGAIIGGLAGFAAFGLEQLHLAGYL